MTAEDNLRFPSTSPNAIRDFALHSEVGEPVREPGHSFVLTLLRISIASSMECAHQFTLCLKER